MSNQPANPLLVASAVVYGVGGLALTFAPAEILTAFDAPTPVVATWLAQLLGAALLGFAFVNWMQRYTKIGGIFGRPVAMPNLMFAMIAFFGSLGAWRHQSDQPTLLAGTVLFGALTVAYGARVFGRSVMPTIWAANPGTEQDPSKPLGQKPESE
jgi:hypothetical protein